MDASGTFEKKNRCKTNCNYWNTISVQQMYYWELVLIYLWRYIFHKSHPKVLLKNPRCLLDNYHIFSILFYYSNEFVFLFFQPNCITMAEKQIDASGMFEEFFCRKKYYSYWSPFNNIENVDDESIQENVSPRIILRVILNGLWRKKAIQMPYLCCWNDI